MEVILIAAVSANGMIAQKVGQRSLDWTSKEDLAFFVEKTKEVGTLIMGARTFETIGKPLKGRRVIVLGEEVEKVDEVEKGTVEFTMLQPRELIEKLKKEGIERVVIAGGASVYGQFLAAGLVTEVYLTIEPVLFGQGLPLASGFDRIDLRLVECRKLGEQAVLLHYQIK